MTALGARRLFCPLLFLLAATVPVASRAQNCWLSHIDHRVTLDESGVWNPTAYRGTMAALTLAQVVGALWLGADDRLGRTAWQGIDAELLSAAGAEVGKYVFTRTRPSQENNPCLWFQGGGNHSFPSGEAAVAAGLVTPYVIEYGTDQPAVYALLLIPLYVGEGRIKNQAHWQTDVLAAWAVGGAAGWYAHSRQVPLTVWILPHSVSIGWSHSF